MVRGGGECKHRLATPKHAEAVPGGGACVAPPRRSLAGHFSARPRAHPGQTAGFPFRPAGVASPGMQAFFRWLGLALALGLASCAAGPDPEDLEVTVVHVASSPAGGGGLGEVALTFTLRWQNARPVPVVLTGGAHRVHLNGVYVGQALSADRVEVPRLSTATQEVTLRLGTWRLARALSAVYRSQQVDYRVTSTLYAEEGGRNRRFRTERHGTVDGSALHLK